MKDHAPGRAAAATRIVLGLVGLGVIAAIWMLDDKDGPPGSGERPVVVKAPLHGADAAAGTETEAPRPRESVSGAVLPGANQARVAPLEVGAAAVADEWRDIRGATVRASDASPVWDATVIALEREVGTVGMAERARARSDIDGNFSMRIPRGVETFRVLTPAPGRSRDDVRPGKDREVIARPEWENGDPASNSVRLVLETGWRLDVSVVDEAGRLRTDIVVTCGSRATKTDAIGRCTFLDLPAADPSVTLALQASAGTKGVTHVVEAPEAGLLFREVKLTLP